MNKAEVGTIVKVKELPDPIRAMKFSGWKAVVKRVEDGKAFVDSDDYVRATGDMQGVSFRDWFAFDELDPA